MGYFSEFGNVSSVAMSSSIFSNEIVQIVSHSVVWCRDFCVSFRKMEGGVVVSEILDTNMTFVRPKNRKHRPPHELCGKICYCSWPPDVSLESDPEDQ